VSNVAFGALMTIFGVGIWLPVGLSIVLGVVPAFILWWIAPEVTTATTLEQLENAQAAASQTSQVPLASVGVMPK
jgi:putative membrane protein